MKSKILIAILIGHSASALAVTSYNAEMDEGVGIGQFPAAFRYANDGLHNVDDFNLGDIDLEEQKRIEEEIDAQKCHRQDHDAPTISNDHDSQGMEAYAKPVDHKDSDILFNVDEQRKAEEQILQAHRLKSADLNSNTAFATGSAGKAEDAESLRSAKVLEERHRKDKDEQEANDFNLARTLQAQERKELLEIKRQISRDERLARIEQANLNGIDPDLAENDHDDQESLFSEKQKQSLIDSVSFEEENKDGASRRAFNAWLNKNLWGPLNTLFAKVFHMNKEQVTDNDHHS